MRKQTVMEERDGKRFGWLGHDCTACQGTGETKEARRCQGCGGTGEAYGEITDAT